METVQRVPVAMIKVRPGYNKRSETEVDAESVKSLAESIQRNGQLHPIIINSEMELISGFRRYCALLELQAAYAECKIIPANKERERLVHLDENLERADLRTSARDSAIIEKYQLYQEMEKKGLVKPGDWRRDIKRQTGLGDASIWKSIKRWRDSTPEVWLSWIGDEISQLAIDAIISLPKERQNKVLALSIGEPISKVKDAVLKESCKIKMRRTRPGIRHPKKGIVSVSAFVSSLDRQMDAIQLNLKAASRSNLEKKVSDTEMSRLKGRFRETARMLKQCAKVGGTVDDSA